MKNLSRRRTMSLCLCFLFALVLLCSVTALSSLTIKAFASSNDFKIHCNATLDDSFADDRIIVVVKSDGFNKNYSVNDFNDIPLQKVEDLSFSTNNHINNYRYEDFYAKTLFRIKGKGQAKSFGLHKSFGGHG